MSGGVRRRAARRLVALALVLVGLSIAGWTALSAAHVDAAGAQPEVPTEPAQDEPRTGPDPTGRPEPPMSQRVVDTAVWLWLVGCMLVAAVVVVRYVRRLDR